MVVYGVGFTFGIIDGGCFIIRKKKSRDIVFFYKIMVVVFIVLGIMMRSVISAKMPKMAVTKIFLLCYKSRFLVFSAPFRVYPPYFFAVWGVYCLTVLFVFMLLYVFGISSLIVGER